MPDAAPGSGAPSRTKAIENTITHDTANRMAVEITSRLFSSTVKSFFRTRMAVLRNIRVVQTFRSAEPAPEGVHAVYDPSWTHRASILRPQPTSRRFI